jgi:hypothetical protein
LLVGFDEDVVAHDLGLLQHVYLYSSVEPDHDVSLADELGRLFSPYPGTIITPTKILPTPVFNADGHYYTEDELLTSHMETFDCVAKDKCVVLSKGCQLHSSKVQLEIPPGHKLDDNGEHSEPATVQIASRIPGGASNQGIAEQNQGNPADIATPNLNHGGDEMGSNDSGDVSTGGLPVTEYNNKEELPVNEGSSSGNSGGGVPGPGTTVIKSPHSVSFEMKTDIYLDSKPTSAATDSSTSRGVPAYQNLQVNGSIVYEVWPSIHFTLALINI